MGIITTLARPLLASSFIFEGVERLRNTADLAPELGIALEDVTQVLPIDLDDQTVTKVVGAAEVGAGALLSIGKFTRLSSGVLAGVTILDAYAQWKDTDAAAPFIQRLEDVNLANSISILGGTLLAFADRKGKPSHAWVRSQRKKEEKRERKALNRA